MATAYMKDKTHRLLQWEGPLVTGRWNKYYVEMEIQFRFGPWKGWYESYPWSFWCLMFKLPKTGWTTVWRLKPITHCCKGKTVPSTVRMGWPVCHEHQPELFLRTRTFQNYSSQQERQSIKAPKSFGCGRKSIERRSKSGHENSSSVPTPMNDYFGVEVQLEHPELKAGHKWMYHGIAGIKEPNVRKLLRFINRNSGSIYSRQRNSSGYGSADANCIGGVNSETTTIPIQQTRLSWLLFLPATPTKESRSAADWPATLKGRCFWMMQLLRNMEEIKETASLPSAYLMNPSGQLSVWSSRSR